MKRFSPSEAAFEGFRIIRSHPGAVLGWAFAYILVQVVIGGLLLLLLGPQIATLSHGAGDTMSAESAVGLMGSLGAVILLAIPLILLISAVFANAVFRTVLRPKDRGLFYLKLGGDEWRMFLLLLCWIGLGILAEIGLVIAFLVLAAAVGTAVHASGGGVSPRLLGVLIGVVLFCVAVWVLVRLSLSGPMTFAERRVSVFGSWRVTRGKFWSLLGCYLLSWIFGILIGILGWVVSLAAGAVITGDWTTVSGAVSDPRALMMSSGLGLLTNMFTVSVIVQLALSSLMGAISRVVMYAPMAAAYRDLTAMYEPEIAFGDAPTPTTPPGVLVL